MIDVHAAGYTVGSHSVYVSGCGTRRRISISLAVTACIIAAYFTISIFQAQAMMPPMLVSPGESGGDWLDPGQLGESMSMPMDQKLVQMARAAGIIKDDNEAYNTGSTSYDSSLEGTYPEDGTGDYLMDDPADDTAYANPAYNNPAYTGNGDSAGGSTDPSGAGSTDSSNNDLTNGVNVTGAWILELEDQGVKNLVFSLAQNKDAIMGYGLMEYGNITQRVAISGTIEGGRLNLDVMPTDSSLDLYKLDLSLEAQPAGSYTAYSAGGRVRSGSVAGTAILNSSLP